MANVLNPEPESITLNTELETPTLDPATELEQPSSESTSNPETAEVVTAVDSPALDADAPTEPVAQAAPAEPEQRRPCSSPPLQVAASARTASRRKGKHAMATTSADSAGRFLCRARSF